MVRVDIRPVKKVPLLDGRNPREREKDFRDFFLVLLLLCKEKQPERKQRNQCSNERKQNSFVIQSEGI